MVYSWFCSSVYNLTVIILVKNMGLYFSAILCFTLFSEVNKNITMPWHLALFRPVKCLFQQILRHSMDHEDPRMIFTQYRALVRLVLKSTAQLTPGASWELKNVVHFFQTVKKNLINNVRALLIVHFLTTAAGVCVQVWLSVLKQKHWHVIPIHGQTTSWIGDC